MAGLNMVVKELTGDMQLSKKELEETQVRYPCVSALVWWDECASPAVMNCKVARFSFALGFRVQGLECPNPNPKPFTLNCGS